MKRRLFSRIAAGSALALTTGLALAHEGHGLAGPSHWHATDVFGVVVVVAAIGLAIWFGRGGK